MDSNIDIVTVCTDCGQDVSPGGLVAWSNHHCPARQVEMAMPTLAEFETMLSIRQTPRKIVEQPHSLEYWTALDNLLEEAVRANGLEIKKP